MHIDTLVRQGAAFVTPHFQSYEDRVCFCLTGESNGPSPQAELFYSTAEGSLRLFDTYPAVTSGGSCSCKFSFDPVSMGIYQKALSFRIVVRDFSQVAHFSLEERSDTTQEVLPSTSAVFTDAAGNKLVPVLQADRLTKLCVSTLPRKVLFVGNSILMGMHGAYGMCASSPKHDYCYHVQQAIRSRNPDCVFSKLYGSLFEHATCREEFEAWWGTDPNGHTGKPARDSFTEDLDLIILQLGDNVGYGKKLANFLVCAPLLLERIKVLCPRARILWVHGWFNSPLSAPPICRFCEQWQVEQINVLSERSLESQSFSGAPYRTPDGTITTVKDTWITHPGDLGMRRIADRIIEALNL